jgi:hypothetical protein
MFDRIAASWELALSSLKVLREEKKLILFPIISGLGCLIVIASFVGPFLMLRPDLDFAGPQGQVKIPWWSYVVAFAFYFCNYFVIIFCNAALVSCALLRFNGEEPSIGSGFQAAASRLPQILAWALVSATVGLLLRIIENANEKIGRFIGALLGTAWTIMTFFVVPVLVVEKVGPFEAVSRSMQILRKTWGEALVGRMGLGLFLFLAFLPILALFGLGISLININTGAAMGCLVLAFAYGLVWGAAGSALNVIFQTALYQYAAFNQVPPGFNGETLSRAFGSKSR